MKYYIVSIMLIYSCLYCENHGKNRKNENVQPVDSFLTPISVMQSAGEQDSSLFSFFEELVKNEEPISIKMASLFIYSIDTSIFMPDAKLVGMGVSYNKDYKRFKILLGSSSKGYIIILNYNLFDKLIDYKKFMNYCYTCDEKSLWADIQENGNQMKVRYYDPVPDGSMPSETDKIIRKIEIWTISFNGKIRLNR